MNKEELFQFIDKNVSGLRNGAIIKDAIEDLVRPITQSNDEDQFWSQVISIVETAEGTKGLDYLKGYEKLHQKLKSKFTITRNK